jgi:hypothetical protein
MVVLKEQNWWFITCHIISSCCMIESGKGVERAERRS